MNQCHAQEASAYPYYLRSHPRFGSGADYPTSACPYRSALQKALHRRQETEVARGAC